jgi:hypothetical protein
MATKRQPPSAPIVEPPLVRPQEGIQLLNAQTEKASVLCATGAIEYEAYRTWRIETEQVLAEAVGRNHPLMLDAIRAGSSFATINMRDPREKAGYQCKAIRAQAKALELCVGYLDRQSKRTPSSQREEADTLPGLRQLLSRFHRVVLELRHRHDERPTLDLVDEYDAQDLIRALLVLQFDDVRQEEWTPSYAGKSGRMDFLLKPQRIVIEVKITRQGRTERQVGEELIIDIARYGSHQDCKRLVCFVYDPDHRIRNPAALQSDLSRTEGEMSVEVIVAPAR